MSPLEPPIHIQQMALGYCLPACAQMALGQFGITVNQTQLARVLGAQVGVGTPFSRAERLAQWDIRVQLTQQISIEELAASLAADVAVITAVTTTPGMPGWGNIRTQHAILVVDVGPEYVAYHDPALIQGPVSAMRNEFLLAWSEMDSRAVLLSRE